METGVIFQKSFGYPGGFPGVNKVFLGWVKVTHDEISYHRDRAGEKIFSIQGSEIEDVRHTEASGFLGKSQEVEVTMRTKLGQSTVRFRSNAMGAKKDVAGLIEAIEILRSEASRDSSVAVKQYSDPDEYQRDAREMASRGWTVKDVTNRESRAGLARIATLGLGALVWKPKATMIVTYVREGERPR